MRLAIIQYEQIFIHLKYFHAKASQHSLPIHQIISQVGEIKFYNYGRGFLSYQHFILKLSALCK